MGGYVVLAMWRRHPQRIAGLGLVDTRAEADSPEARAKRNVAAGQVREIGVRVLADDMLPRLLAAHNQGNERIAGPLYEMILRQPAEGMIGALGAMRDRIDSTDTLATITVPTTVIVGDADVVTPRADAERMATLIPRARLVIVPAAGHMSPVEDAETVNRALAELAARVG